MVRPIARRFYVEILRALSSSGVPYVVGGALALKHFAGICRDTKDLDIFLARQDLDRAMAALAERGLETELTYPHWLGKARRGDDFVDIIFDSANGVCPVDEDWFIHAPRCALWGQSVLVCPAEELIVSKAFVMERERFDGADIYHLLEARAESLDWDRLQRRFGAHWRVLLGHLVFFSFVYPRRRGAVPERVMITLLDRAKREMASEPKVETCGGTLLSREQYLVDLRERGYTDARLPPSGNVSPSALEVWTAAIGTDK
jgi:hypothetical protein